MGCGGGDGPPPPCYAETNSEVISQRGGEQVVKGKYRSKNQGQEDV